MIGIPDEKYGEDIMAFIVRTARPGISMKAV